MPKLIIHNLWAVGMHHWGPRELMVGAGYNLQEDLENSFDPNAVAIFDGPNKKAYLKRESAEIVKFLFNLRLTNQWLLKPKEVPIVCSRRTGPQQRCSIGCIYQDEGKLEIAKVKLQSANMTYEMKK